MWEFIAHYTNMDSDAHRVQKIDINLSGIDEPDEEYIAWKLAAGRAITGKRSDELLGSINFLSC